MVTKKLERTYTIPLRAGFIKVPKYYRAKRAINQIKTYVKKHMKTEDVKIGPFLNEHVWSKGITNPPGKVTVKVIKQDDFVTVELQGHDYQIKKIQTEKTEAPTSFKDKLAAKLKQSKSETPESEVIKSEKVDKKEIVEPENVNKKEEIIKSEEVNTNEEIVESEKIKSVEKKVKKPKKTTNS